MYRGLHCILILFLLALSHIHVSAAYRSRIYENFDTPRSEPYGARATYVPRSCDVPAMFPWRIYIRMEFHFRMYDVSRRMCYVRVTYVWHMKCTRDVSTAYVSYVPFLSAAYLFCTDCFLIPIRTIGCVHFFMQFAHYSYQLSEVEYATGEFLDNLD